MSFRIYHQPSLKAALSAALGGFDKDILERFYSLSPDQLARLFNIYSDTYGDGPAAYARQTYPDWKQGVVRPSALTINRLLDNLPLVLDFVGKCELLRKLRERHRKPEHISLKVKADDWKEPSYRSYETSFRRRIAQTCPRRSKGG